MPTDENTRLRIRQYLIELMDEEAADAILESMPPIPWTELATKDDLARLESKIDLRFNAIDNQFVGIAPVHRHRHRFAGIDDRLDRFDRRFDHMDLRFDQIDLRSTRWRGGSTTWTRGSTTWRRVSTTSACT